VFYEDRPTKKSPTRYPAATSAGDIAILRSEIGCGKMRSFVHAYPSNYAIIIGTTSI
jgi:hypothetical protein